MAIVVVTGRKLWDAMEKEIAERVPKSKRPGCENCYESGPLNVVLGEFSQRGIIGAELVNGMRGWYLRYDSGLRNFDIIARVGDFEELDGSYEGAKKYAEKWVARDAEKRYAIRKVMGSY